MNAYRYERKFFVSGLTEAEVGLNVKLHPAMFREVYPYRYINNIYFDSVEMDSFVDNVDGVRDRVKVRIRWYGQLFGEVARPVLELKIKQGMLGTKRQFPLKSVKIEQGLDSNIVDSLVQQSEVPDNVRALVKSLEVVLVNRYRRRYYQTADGLYRLTLDSDMMYYRVHNSVMNLINGSRDRDNLILELKYAQPQDEGAEKITNCFPFHLTKSSKYVAGMICY